MNSDNQRNKDGTAYDVWIWEQRQHLTEHGRLHTSFPSFRFWEMFVKDAGMQVSHREFSSFTPREGRP